MAVLSEKVQMRQIVDSGVRPEVRICLVLANNGVSMPLVEVARQAGMSPQRARYQLKNLVSAGVVLRDSKLRYGLQPFFYDRECRDGLFASLRPMIGMIAPMMNFSHVDEVDGRRDIALVNSMRMFLAIADVTFLREATLSGGG